MILDQRPNDSPTICLGTQGNLLLGKTTDNDNNTFF
jgi:hypothetical protein